MYNVILHTNERTPSFIKVVKPRENCLEANVIKFAFELLCCNAPVVPPREHQLPERAH
jgi:hypothetical protein